MEGPDGYRLEGRNTVARISRPFEELVAATHGRHHQYPDGFALFTGTLFAPTQDRDEPGQGFTHKHGDVVTIRSRHLGALINRVGASEELPEWTFGLRQLFGYLEGQRLLPVGSAGRELAFAPISVIRHVRWGRAGSLHVCVRSSD